MHPTRTAQRGFTTLAISLILLLVLTMMTLYSAQVGVLKQRIAANEVRERESRINADALIESGLQFVFANRRHLRSTTAGGWLEAGAERWSTCAAGDTDLPCGDGTQNLYDANFVYYSFTGSDIDVVSDANSQLHLVADADPDGSGGPDPGDPDAGTPGAVYTLIAVSPANDLTGESQVRQAFWLVPLLSDSPDAPLIVAGGIALGGNFNVAANPNGGGPGVPLSVWTAQDSGGGGSMNTCQIEEFDNDGGCDNNAETGQLSWAGHEGLDILDVDGNVGENPDSTYFPPDLFQYVFGTPASQWQDFKNSYVPADHQLDNCNGLSAASAGLYWVDGNCDVPGNVGTKEHPVILVVQEGNLKMNGNSEFFGLLFSFDAPNNGVGPGNIQINGTATLNGSLMANHAVNLSNGTFNARYDADVLQLLTQADENKGVGKVPGSWADYL